MKLNTSFSNLSHAAFFAKAKAIVLKLTTEPLLTLVPNPWPASFPARTAVTTAYAEFEVAYSAALDGAKSDRDTRDAKRAVLTTLLQQVAPYLVSVAETAGDVSILDLSGYDVPNAPVPLPPGALPAPEIILQRATLSGVLVVRASRVMGAGCYQVQVCQADPSVEANWHTVSTGKRCRRIELTGLTPGQLYFVRVCAIGSDGAGAWSDVANLMAA